VLTDSNSINFEVCPRVLSQFVYALLSLIQVMLNMSPWPQMTTVSRFENWSMAVSTKSWLIIIQRSIWRIPFLVTLQRIFNTCLKNCRLLFSAVISEQFSKNRMIIYVVAAKIWYLKNVWFLLGHPVQMYYGTGTKVTRCRLALR